ncbi:MAG: hypothetical protein GC157_07510 [Frankiales bacterium]|nr:hypothetical protein [Frankiales bacterium]
MDDTEIFASEVYDDVAVTEVIRPAAIVTEESARAILVELTLNDASRGGLWTSDPRRWTRWTAPWAGPAAPGSAQQIGSIEVAYGTPSRYEITIYRVTVTHTGAALGWTVASLSNEALGFGGLDLATCPRAELAAPPKPFRF